MGKGTTKKTLYYFTLLFVTVFLFVYLGTQKTYADTPEIVIEQTSITESVSEGYGYLDVISGVDLSFISSDSSVVRIGYYNDYWCELEYIHPGSAIITVVDEEGKSLEVPVTLTEAEWHLSQTEWTDTLSNEEGEIEIETEDWNLEFTVRSSNKKVVYPEIYGYYLSFWYEGVGTATVTVTDQYGKSESIEVTVAPDPLTFSTDAISNYPEYDDETYIYIYPVYDDNRIVSVSSSDTSIATVKKIHDEYGDYIRVKPVSAGTVTFTAQDQYGQTGTITITLSQKYMDEYLYLIDLEWAWIFSDEDFDYEGLAFGYKNVYCLMDIEADVYTTINGTKYTAKRDDDGYYVFKSLPSLAVGKTITIYCQKGEAIAKHKVKVVRRSGKESKVTVKAQTYTGKALTPALTVKIGKTTLKKGTDYTVKYSNNKSVGTATAKITYIGNYKDTKSVKFKINPKGTTISSVTAAKKGFTVKWKKQTTQTTGYQIQYSTDKSFKSGNKTVTISKNSTVSNSITGLKAKKKYYVRVRTYKKVGEDKFYSSWSTAKVVTTK